MRVTVGIAIGISLLLSGCGGSGDSSKGGDTTPFTGVYSSAVVVEAKPESDPAIPLDSYKPIPDVVALKHLIVAFQKSPPSDDDLLALIDHQLPDSAFERRDLLEKERPVLEARLEAARQQRHFRVDVVSASMLREPGDAQETRPRWSVGDTHMALSPYDFDRRGFPLVRCLSGTRVRVGSAVEGIQFSALPHDKDACLLPVADEAAARKLEAGRAGYLAVYIEAALYFTVTEGMRGTLYATLDHAKVTIFDPADPAHKTPLTTVAVAF